MLQRGTADSSLDALQPNHRSGTSRYMKVGATRLHYCVEGHGPTLLLLHGMFSSLHAWDGWVSELASSYRIVRIDLPGFGLSDHLRSDDYTAEHAVALIEQLRIQLELDRFHLAGNCLGGFFGWSYAAVHPESIDKLILLDPIGYPEKLPPLLALFSLPLVGRVGAALSPRFLVSRNLRALYGEPSAVQEEVVERYSRMLERSRSRRALVKACQQLRSNRHDASLRAKIRRLKAPTLLMWGACDTFTPPTQLGDWCRDLPSAEVKVYEGVGHMPMEERPTLTARDAHAFLSAGGLAASTVEARGSAGEPRDDGSAEPAPGSYARGA